MTDFKVDVQTGSLYDAIETKIASLISLGFIYYL